MIKIDINQIIHFAEVIETAGAEFYLKAADISSGETKKVFKSLAAMEENHKETFAKMFQARNDVEDYLESFDPDDGTGLYLEYTVKSDVFGVDPATIIKGNESAIDLLEFAIAREKDTVVFYKSMKDAISMPADKAIVEKVIKEEYGHILTLTDIMVKIKDKGH